MLFFIVLCSTYYSLVLTLVVFEVYGLLLSRL